jgi:hypothetical protein
MPALTNTLFWSWMGTISATVPKAPNEIFSLRQAPADSNQPLSLSADPTPAAKTRVPRLKDT